MDSESAQTYAQQKKAELHKINKRIQRQRRRLKKLDAGDATREVAQQILDGFLVQRAAVRIAHPNANRAQAEDAWAKHCNELVEAQHDRTFLTMSEEEIKDYCAPSARQMTKDINDWNNKHKRQNTTRSSCPKMYIEYKQSAFLTDDQYKTAMLGLMNILFSTAQIEVCEVGMTDSYQFMRVLIKQFTFKCSEDLHNMASRVNDATASPLWRNAQALLSKSVHTMKLDLFKEDMMAECFNWCLLDNGKPYPFLTMGHENGHAYNMQQYSELKFLFDDSGAAVGGADHDGDDMDMALFD